VFDDACTDTQHLLSNFQSGGREFKTPPRPLDPSLLRSVTLTIR